MNNTFRGIVYPTVAAYRAARDKILADERRQKKAELTPINAAFQNELAALLTKYKATIDYQSDDCSDWHGVSGFKLVVDIEGIIFDLA